LKTHSKKACNKKKSRTGRQLTTLKNEIIQGTKANPDRPSPPQYLEEICNCCIPDCSLSLHLITDDGYYNCVTSQHGRLRGAETAKIASAHLKNSKVVRILLNPLFFLSFAYVSSSTCCMVHQIPQKCLRTFYTCSSFPIYSVNFCHFFPLPLPISSPSARSTDFFHQSTTYLFLSISTVTTLIQVIACLVT
jgi:hypothetical protein